MSAVADVLNGAADLLEREGWWQGDYRGPNGETCVDGALVRAVGQQPGGIMEGDVGLSYLAAVKVLRHHLGREFVSAWNDDPQRTKAEVVAALRAAAEQAA